MQSLTWSEVFVWISARLRFYKKIFRIDFESEISKVKMNFSVKSVRVLKCLHNFITRQEIWWNCTSKKLGTTYVFWNWSSVWSFSTCFGTFLLDWANDCKGVLQILFSNKFIQQHVTWLPQLSSDILERRQNIEEFN